MTPLEQAIQVTLNAHAEQIDSDNMPHVVHSLEVMLLTKRAFETTPVPGYTLEEMLIAAVLHDVVEDNKTFSIEYIQKLFGASVAKIVDALTRRIEESYRDFIYRAKADPAARLVKICDLLHNRSRTHFISEKKASWRKKLEYKYAIATAVLNDNTEPTWEGASFEVHYDSEVPHFFIADPNGKRVEIMKEEADNVKISFKIDN